MRVPREPQTPLAQYRVPSSNAGVRVSPICLGGMSLTNTWYECPLNFDDLLTKVFSKEHMAEADDPYKVLDNCYLC
jgi:hypothetical protein